MPADPNVPLHDIADRVIRRALQHPENLRAFLAEVLKDLAKGFDCARARLLPRDFLLDDWRGREADMLFEVPYRNAENERLALVCLLIEHQTRSDPRMPLRTLVYAVLYWEREWRRWETMSSPRPEFRLTPIVPIVLHASPHPWGSARTLAELMGDPPEFRVFCPQWEPLFWELAGHSTRELLDSREAFFQVLSVVRAEDDPTEEFEPVFLEAMQRLGPLHDSDRVLWTEMLSAVLTWARPGTEKDHWQNLAEAAQADDQRKREVRTMSQTIAQTIYEEGKLEGKVEGIQQTLLRQGNARFGAADESVQNAIRAISDAEKLAALSERILQVSSWTDLLRIP